MEEDILKTFYQYGERKKDFTNSLSSEELRSVRAWDKRLLKRRLKFMKLKGWLIEKNGSWLLSHTGYTQSKRVVRLHRLWELYLNQYVRIEPNNVHENAEWIEHIITPELEQALDVQLGFPEKDPHDSKIP